MRPEGASLVNHHLVLRPHLSRALDERWQKVERVRLELQKRKDSVCRRVAELAPLFKALDSNPGLETGAFFKIYYFILNTRNCCHLASFYDCININNLR